MTSAMPLPALLGGSLVRPQGPPDWPLPDEEVLCALQRVYRDNSYGKYYGIYVERLEQRLAEYHQVRHVVTCGSGTYAVELALRALKIGEGDEVLLAGYDYGGNFLSIHAVGARPVLIDVDPENWNVDPRQVAGAIGPATRAFIVSHLHGGLVPMRAIMEWSQAHGLRVIEDAAQMPGALVEGRRAGTWGDVGILSFGGSKLLSAGRGGALLTRHDDVHHRARLWLNRGNNLCPLSELQAAVLLPQLAKLDSRNEQRTTAVRSLVEQVDDVPGIKPFRNRSSGSEPGYYKVGFQFDSEQFGLSRDQFVTAVCAEGLALAEGFRALHMGRSPARFRPGGLLTEAARAHGGCVVLHHPILLSDPGELEQVSLAIHKIYAHALLLSENWSTWVGKT